MTRRLGAVVPILLVLATGCVGPPAGLFVTTTRLGVPERLPVTVSRPDGPGPFTAVVIVHDCTGLGPRSSGPPGRWAREIVSRGYLVVIPDSFTPRGYPAGHGTTTGGNPAAWADSIREVAAFFDRYLAAR